mgnify:CR=1 FL=1
MSPAQDKLPPPSKAFQWAALGFVPVLCFIVGVLFLPRPLGGRRTRLGARLSGTNDRDMQGHDNDGGFCTMLLLV